MTTATLDELIDATASMSDFQQTYFLGQLAGCLAAEGTLTAAEYLAAAEKVRGWSR